MLETPHLYQSITETLTEKPCYPFTIQINEPKPAKRRTLLEYMQKKPKYEIETERSFIIYPQKVRNQFRIAGRSALLPKEIREPEASSTASIVLPLIDKHLKDVVYIVASAIQNNSQEPTPELLKFVEDNFDNIDLWNCTQRVFESHNMLDFLNTIVLISGAVEILEPRKSSLKNGSELIASHIA